MILTFLMHPSFSNTLAIVIFAMFAIITFSSKSITCWFMATAVTIAGTAWNKLQRRCTIYLTMDTFTFYTWFTFSVSSITVWFVCRAVSITGATCSAVLCLGNKKLLVTGCFSISLMVRYSCFIMMLKLLFLTVYSQNRKAKRNGSATL